MKKSNRLTLYIVIAMIAGVILGYFVHDNASAETIQSFSKNLKLFTTIFLRLVQMIIAPLVFSTLVVGIAKLGDLKTVGRVGGKALLWFISASLVSLLLGMLLVNIFQPGKGIDLSNADISGAQDLVGKTQEFSIQKFVEHVFPKSVIDAMATNEILQLVVFSIFFGVATAALGEKAKIVVKGLDAVAHVILKMVGYVMNFAPIGVFGAIAAVIATKGLDVFIFYGKYLLYFLIGIAALWAILLTVGFIILGKRLPDLLRRIFPPLIIAFSTTSSEAVFPKLTEELERFGCKDKIVSFILPLGYSFNLDGSMMYMTFASIAIAQAYGIQLDIGTQLTMLIVLMLTSKGIAGVPRASLVVVTATCAMFNIPPEGIALILPIDHFCDMFRTATNVVGNALATSVVSKWEGALDEPTDISVSA
ncbi:MAG: dicarboxylate/amino acid:cation symporter [Sediminibacterium sp. Gen4]|jgi:Na+/H+-dicarboxylate symporter|uniref:dicarboxylate/amino acid:cation symporter n=1 Tax=unclassified Sediminibacterium TaxID=2635961 RepID=UPI0015BBB76F|nr:MULTISPECIES: dicarboxylate/amino acid:cation symporter [unclassified Sediminibacterium]MBW0160460.1 dicarboxylate/amino acid:cation symporter [Sediminibacterium sp.]MBW0165431.1 dicarboxylate/amino acid:cation symporter [Sediminibacterium sp.]MDZ4070514.1 dicarboxylate/amino acid:cation symporter [Sediminibacterium sp.]NWK65374.1 dicarboxylate/amino acid:cation symporter [Sediminibacterium sp. Gen4]